MKHLLAVLLALSACKTSSDASVDDAVDDGELRAAAAGAHRLGAPAPAMTLTTIDGNPLELEDGKPVYLKMWATWCTPCREQMPKFERIYETYGDRLQVIAVNAGLNDDAASVRAFREKYGLHMPIVIDDGRLAAALDLQVTPQHVLIGRDGRIAYVGHLDNAKLDEAIEKVLAQPSANPTRAEPVAAPRAFRPGDRVLAPADRPRGIVLFADWCESYLEETQPETARDCRRVREEVDRLMARGDVEWSGIATGIWSSTESIEDYKTSTKTRLPIALDADGSQFRAFGVRAMPTVILVDRDGKLARVIRPDEHDLDAAVRAL